MGKTKLHLFVIGDNPEETTNMAELFREGLEGYVSRIEYARSVNEALASPGFSSCDMLCVNSGEENPGTLLSGLRAKGINIPVVFLMEKDPLTGIYNRSHFLKKLQSLDSRKELPLSLILGDVDGLSLINDAFGYQKGDKLLQETARIIKECCSGRDIIARWGGDEFAVLLPQASFKSARETMASIKRNCEKNHCGPIKLSISLGCATKENVCDDPLELLKRAEMEVHRNKLMEGKAIREGIIASLIQALGEKDYETQEHSWRMQKLAMSLGSAFTLDDSQLDDLVMTVTLHDVGKIAVPEHILMKPDALSPEEWEIIKGHSERGYRIAMASSKFNHIAPYILSHHERWDGKGYPQGLKGEEIPLIARIVSIIDAYEVMVNGRPYKAPVSKKEAVAELQKCAGSQFDPQLVKVFIEVLKDMD